MPTGNLPAKPKALFEEVYSKSKGEDCDEECAAKKAWSAVKSAGWKKEGDKWVKSKALCEFSFAIKKATLDPETGERRWRADTSDTVKDSYGDKMSLELYNDFLQRIESEEPPPEEFRSDFWNGGKPYLSISHYPDLNGDGVPGTTEAIYIDGSYLKAKGTFLETPLGIACWEAIKADLQNDVENKVRISIAFLDYKHRHLSNDYMFVRSDLDDFCPECLKELIKGEFGGKEFLEGHLIHLALTRVPVNKRTIMEVDKSMTTKVEDAESIVGEELAEELEKETSALEVGRALVTKSEDGSFVLEFPDLDKLYTLLSEIKDLVTPPEVEETEEVEEVEEKAEVEEEPVKVDAIEQLAVALSTFGEGFNDGFGQMAQKLDILIAANSAKPNVTFPERRAILDAAPRPRKAPGEPRTIAEAIYESTYGQLPE